MTTIAPERPVPPAPAPRTTRRRWRDVPRERTASVALLAGTAVLYLWGLGESGWANSFYAAAAQAGSQSWTAFLFGASDAAGSITVDKPPLALWPMALSVRVFGLSSWSVLVPQALMGVASVAVLTALVRRATGHRWVGLLAGLALALTPVAVLMFRFDNPDALLTLLLTAAAYATLRAIESPRRALRWVVLGGVLIGLAFLTKTLQAFLVLPGLAIAYAGFAAVPWRRRVGHLLAALAATVVAGGWWVALVELWPASSRPYIGGSQGNDFLELTFGYNGLGRLTGDEAGSVGGGGGGQAWGSPGAFRLLDAENGGQMAWLLPAAVVLGVAALWAGTRAVRAAATLLLGWLVVTAATFSLMAGIYHAYYTVALAPAVAGCVALGAGALWGRRETLPASAVLGFAVALTSAWSFVLLDRDPDWQPWLRWAVVVPGLAAAPLVVGVRHLPQRAVVAVATAAVAAGLAGPAAYALSTAGTPHAGGIPAAGPSPSGLGGPGGPGGLLDGSAPGAALTALLLEDADSYEWVAATVGANAAAGYQLATERSVMPIGGFNGTDPSPTLVQFRADVAAGRIHWFVAGGTGDRPGGFPGFGGRSDIDAWVAQTFTARTIDGVTVYDLT